MRRLAAICLFCAVPVLAVAGVGQQGFGSGPPSYRVNAQFDNATGIVSGVDVKVAGARVGRVATMGITDSQLAVITLEVKDGFGPFHRDAECSVRLQSLIGEKFIECSVGSPDEPAIPDGGTLPVSRTHSPVDLDLVNNVFRKPYDERFRIILNEFGTGLAGRGEDLNVVIRRAAPALEQANRVLRILARQNRILRQLVEDAEVDIGELADKRKSVAGFIDKSRIVSQASAARRQELAETFRDLPAMLRELGPTMRQLGSFADEITPVQRNLSVAADDLRRTIKALGEFSEASTPAFDTLGDAAKVGRRAVVKARPLVSDLKPFAKAAVPVGVDLAEFLEASDSRKYSAEPNPAAPTPEGYTALEGIFNYIFYQQTAINGFDELGYFLRVTLVRGSQCEKYTDKPKVGPGSECRAHLGEPFVSDKGEFQQRRASRKRSARRERERAVEGQPAPQPGSELAPEPAKPPIKLPEVKLPGDVQELLDSITENLPGAPRARPLPGPLGNRGRSNQALLDYLMGN